MDTLAAIAIENHRRASPAGSRRPSHLLPSRTCTPVAPPPCSRSRRGASAWPGSADASRSADRKKRIGIQPRPTNAATTTPRCCTRPSPASKDSFPDLQRSRTSMETAPHDAAHHTAIWPLQLAPPGTNASRSRRRRLPAGFARWREPTMMWGGEGTGVVAAVGASFRPSHSSPQERCGGNGSFGPTFFVCAICGLNHF